MEYLRPRRYVSSGPRKAPRMSGRTWGRAATVIGAAALFSLVLPGAAPPMPPGKIKLNSARAPITVAARPQVRPDLRGAFRGPLGTYLRGRKCSTRSPFLSETPLAQAGRPCSPERDQRGCGHRKVMGLREGHQPERVNLCIARGPGWPGLNMRAPLKGFR